MVKLAQHIEWSSQLPIKAGEGPSSGGQNAKKVERLLSNGKPRKTLAELFEARATPAPPATPSSSSTTATTTLTTSPLSRTWASSPFSSATSLPVSSGAPSSSSSYSSSACLSSLSSSTSSSAVTSVARATPSSGTVPAHVTFNDKPCDIQRKSSAHKSSELGASIKRSSSARKIADSSAHEGLQTPVSVKKISKSGPLTLLQPSPRSPSTNSSNLEPGIWISPAKLIDGSTYAKFNEKPAKNSRLSEQGQRTPSTYSSNSEQRFRSPFHAREHNQKGFFPKAIDFVGGIQTQSRFKQSESDPLVANRHDAEHVEKAKTVQGTPTKGKRLRRGLFGLLSDGGGTKHVGSEARESDTVALRSSEKLGTARSAISPDHETGGCVRSPMKITGNVGLGNELADGGMQRMGSWISGNLGAKHEEGREAKSLTVEIPDKMVGLAWFGTVPRLLLSGTHCVPSEGFMLEQVVSERSSYVKHGMLHRVRIHEGHLGVAWVDGKALLLEEGVSVHMCPSNRFSYITTDDKMISEKEFVLGPFRVVTVHDSEVGIKFCNRQPQILYTGRHCLSISKVEVFAGFESLLRRQSNVREASALSSDNMKVTANVWLEWQIKAEDAAAARLANITDVEGAVCSQVRRAFNLVIWEVNGQDLNLQLTGSLENFNSHTHPSLKNLSSNIHRESQDLFEEQGWTVTIWDLQVRQLVVSPEVKDGQG